MDPTRKQKLLYEHFEWKYPETLYWGCVKVLEFGGFFNFEYEKLNNAQRIFRMG